MSNEARYYDPIIQALVASAQQLQSANDLKQRGDIAKQEQASRQAQLKIDEQRLADTHEHNLGMLDVQKQLAGAQLEANRLTSLRMARELSASGVPTASINSALPQGLSATGLPTPADEAARLQGLAQSQAQGTAQGTANVAQPFQREMQQNTFSHESNMAVLQHSNQLDMLNHQAQVQKDLAGYENQFKAIQGDLSRQSQEKIAAMDMGGRMAIAQLPYNPPVGSLGTMAIASLNGAPLNPDHPVDLAVLRQMYDRGWHPVPKGDIEALKASQTIIPVLKQMDDVIKLLPESSVGAIAQNATQDAAATIGLKTHFQTQVDKLNTNIINIGKLIEGLTGGKVTNRMMGISEGGVVGKGMTKADAVEKLNNLKDMFSNKIDNIILGGLPDDAKQIIYKMNGLKPTSELLGNPSAPAVPPAVSNLMKTASPGIHTLSDGSKWMKDANGTITAVPAGGGK